MPASRAYTILGSWVEGGETSLRREGDGAVGGLVVADVLLHHLLLLAVLRQVAADTSRIPQLGLGIAGQWWPSGREGSPTWQIFSMIRFDRITSLSPTERV